MLKFYPSRTGHEEVEAGEGDEVHGHLAEVRVELAWGGCGWEYFPIHTVGCTGTYLHTHKSQIQNRAPGKRRQQVMPEMAAETRWFRSPIGWGAV